MNNEKKPVKTVKRQKVIMLPEVRNYIVQPNRITNAIYNYTLFQERIFTAILYRLQEPIQQSLNNKNYNQLDLFANENVIKFTIPLKDISQPSQYPQVKKALKSMASVAMEIPYQNNSKENRIRYTNFFDADIPAKADYCSNIQIIMKKVVAEKLIEIDKDHSSRSINFTRYIYEIAQQAQNKYTARLYKIISSWKKKGGFTIKLEDLKERLGVINKYPVYKDFKKRVIKPAFEELYEKSDCWFNCNSADFEIRDRYTVTHLNFKVITPDLAEMEDKKTSSIRDILLNHFDFKNDDLMEVRHILEDYNIPRERLMKKIMEIAEAMSGDKIINFKNKYAKKSLLSEFGER